MPTVLAQELLSDGGGAREGRWRSEMPKVTHRRPSSSPGDRSRRLRVRAEGRGWPEHLSLCSAGGRLELGLEGGWIFLLCLCVDKVGLGLSPLATDLSAEGIKLPQGGVSWSGGCLLGGSCMYRENTPLTHWVASKGRTPKNDFA